LSEDLKAKSFNINDLIDYQENSVVSREIIKKETGTVTIFAFDKGEGLSEHTAPFDAMVQVIDGTAEIVISGNKNIVQMGEMIIMPGNVPHALNAVEKFKMVLTMIRSN
jgi:quercetin dioxygenase-like cupin family protein